MKRVWVAILIVTMMSVLTAACVTLTATSEEAPDKNTGIDVAYGDPQLSFADIPCGAVNWEDYEFPFPKPSADRFEMKLGDTKALYCYGMDRKDTASFKATLKNSGWVSHYKTDIREIYVRGNQILSLTDQSFFSEDKGGGHIRIHYRAGYAETFRESGITKDDARPLIQAAIDADPSKYEEGASVTALVELDVPDVFEKAHMQIFTAFGRDICFCNFIVSHDEAIRTFIDPFANDTTSSVCVADIDSDGEYELISLFGWGSGIWRIEIVAYKFGKPPWSDSSDAHIYIAYHNTWFPDYNGDVSCLCMVTLDDGQVRLHGYRFGEDGTTHYGDYGELVPSGSKLVPSQAEYFPFRESWNDSGEG